MTKQLSIVRGNGVSLVCWPSAIGFPFCWMVNLTVTSNLAVSFDGREAKKGNDEDEDSKMKVWAKGKQGSYRA